MSSNRDGMSRLLNEEGDFEPAHSFVSVDHTIGDDEYGEGSVGPALRTGNNTQVQFEFKQVTASSLDLELEGDIDAPGPNALLLPSEPSPGRSRGASSASDSASCFSVEYYQRYFDVDTEQVQYRLKASVWPYKNAFLKTIRGKGDLYGPFWVASTLIFVIAFAGNIVDYNNSYMRGEQDAWRYDFGKMSLAATMIYGYVSLVPFGVWAALKYKTNSAPLLMDVITLYGYSIAVFIPAAFLCIFPWIGATISWLVIVLAMALSGLVVGFNMYDTLKEENDKSLAAPFVGMIIACHIGLALALKFYFFQHEQYHPLSITITSTSAVPTTVTEAPG